RSRILSWYIQLCFKEKRGVFGVKIKIYKAVNNRIAYTFKLKFIPGILVKHHDMDIFLIRRERNVCTIFLYIITSCFIFYMRFYFLPDQRLTYFAEYTNIGKFSHSYATERSN